MTTFDKDNTEKIISNLLLLSTLEAGKTLSTSSLTIIDHGSWSSSFWRRYSGENRALTIEFIKGIFLDAINCLDSNYSQELFDKILNALAGFASLKETYKDDATIVAEINNIISSTHGKLFVLKQIYDNKVFETVVEPEKVVENEKVVEKEELTVLDSANPSLTVLNSENSHLTVLEKAVILPNAIEITIAQDTIDESTDKSPMYQTRNNDEIMNICLSKDMDKIFEEINNREHESKIKIIFCEEKTHAPETTIKKIVEEQTILYEKEDSCAPSIIRIARAFKLWVDSLGDCMDSEDNMVRERPSKEGMALSMC